jgi:hypothetical protein
MAKKYTKVGTILRDKKNPERMYLAAGDTKSEKYGFNAQIVVFRGSKDDPTVLAKQINGFLSIFPPKNENAPEHVVGDLMIVENDEE